MKPLTTLSLAAAWRCPPPPHRVHRPVQRRSRGLAACGARAAANSARQVFPLRGIVLRSWSAAIGRK
jgi:hypothetical protein